ncbi:MAG: hypothetical protein O6766_11725 [Gammaproteobacteria bacterium]|nr:hypothetical protein [Gammaproteobacteria bacterium]
MSSQPREDVPDNTAGSNGDTTEAAALVDVPNYFDPGDIIKVPAHELQDDDRPFHAIRIGNVTLVAKVYWRIVHY